jgi:tetratricopeptide (TPR) repeat protein
MGLFGKIKKLLFEDISNLDEYECFVKASENNWDYQKGTYCKPNKALKYLDRAIELNPSKVEAYIGRGQAYQMLNNLYSALNNFNKAIELEPDVETYRMRAMCYWQYGNSKNAFDDLNTAINLDSANIGLYIVRAGISAALKQFESAIIDYDKIIGMEPDNFEHYVCRGFQYYELGEYQNAIKDYNIAIELEPNISQIREYRRLANEKEQESVKNSTTPKKQTDEPEGKGEKTIEQLAENLVWGSHSAELTSHDYNLESLQKAFEINNEEINKLLKLEYDLCSFSLSWLRYFLYFKEKDIEKLKSFNNFKTEKLTSNLLESYSPESLETLLNLYTKRFELYKDAYESPNPFENMASLFFWLIDYSHRNQNLCFHPPKYSEIKPPGSKNEGWKACKKIVESIWRIMEHHINFVTIIE